MGVLSVVKDYGTELLDAVRTNDVKTFKHICEKHLRHDSQISNLCTMDIKHRPTKKFACPLILAARLEDPSILKYMLETGVNPNFIHQSVSTTRKRDVITPLHIAVELGLIQNVDILLNFNADPNVPDHNEDTPFIVAIKRADWMLMKMMLSKGANPSIADAKGNAPLHVATLYGHLQMVKELLRHNADIHQKGYLGVIPSHIAAREGHIHLIQVFCSADPGIINTRIPCYADRREKSVLHLAAERGHAETVVALIDQFSADVNLTDSQGNTPLHCVVLHYYQPNKMRDKDYFYATAKVLVKCRAAVNEKNQNGETPLHLAAAHNHSKIVELLLNIGANAFAEDNNRMKPIDVVPDDDTVSKQLLKSAMTNPKPPINASSLSLLQNSSFHVGLPGQHLNGAAKNSFLTKSMLMDNSNLSIIKRKDGILMSSSSMSSIVPVKGRHDHSGYSPRTRDLPPRQSANRSRHYDSPSQRRKHGVLAYPRHYGRTHSHHRRTSHGGRSNLSSVFSGSSEDLQGRSFYHSDADIEDDSFAAHNGSRRDGRRRHEERAAGTHARDSERRKYYKSSERSETKERYEEKKRKNRRRGNDASGSVFSDDDGVRIHTFPGKPTTIEVEYDRGPITIELENPDLLNDRTKDSRPRAKVQKKQHGQAKKQMKKSASQDSLSDNNKDSLNDWFNEMRKYNKEKKKKKKRAKSASDVLPAEDELEDQAEERNEIEVENERIKEMESRRRQKEKLRNRQSKQQQYEEQLRMEKLPIEDPEPPAERLESRIEDSFSDESSFDSESFDEEISRTQRVLNDSASERILQVTRSVHSRWSQDEEEDRVAAKEGKIAEYNARANGEKIRKQNDKYRLLVAEQLTKKIQKRKSESLDYLSDLVEVPKNEVIRMETVTVINEQKQKSVNDEDPDKETKNTAEEEPKSAQRKGLNMRVAGETPKAYTRKGKSSARAKFILASPARIESSSEASDSEQSFSNASSKRRAEWEKPLTPVYGNPSPAAAKPKRGIPFKTNDVDPREAKGFPKLYKTFGKIETKTDALEEALANNEISEDESKGLDGSLNTEESSTASPKTSKIIPEQYQIRKPDSKTGEPDVSLEESSLTDESDEENTVEYKISKETDFDVGREKSWKERKERKNASLDEILETYAEEPNTRWQKKPTNTKKTRPESREDGEKEETEEMVVRRAKKKKLVTKFPLPEGFSPEVWEEACNNSPLASSDTYADVSGEKRSAGKSRKTKSKTTSRKNKNDASENSGSKTAKKDQTTKHFDGLGLDVSIPVLAESFKETDFDSFENSGTLDVIIPAGEADKKKAKKREVTTEVRRVEIESNSKKRQDKNREKTTKSADDDKKSHVKTYVVVESKNPPKALPTNPVKVNRPPIPLKSKRPSAADDLSSSNPDIVEDLNDKMYSKKNKVPLPKHPSRPYDVLRMAAYSDTEAGAYGPSRKNYDYVHSEAEASDFEAPRRPGPGMSYREAALNSINSDVRRYADRSLLLRQPGHHDKNFNYLFKLYRPRKRRRVRSAHLFPTAGKYGEKELRRVLSSQSFTESETEVDPNRSFVTEDESDELNASTRSLNVRRNKKISPIFESLMRYRKLKQLRLEMKEKENDPIGPLEPEGVDLERYDEIARTWMEQVDRDTVLKSKTMCMTVLPKGSELSNLIVKNRYATESDRSGEDVPQWVVARSRFVRSKGMKDDFQSEFSAGKYERVDKHIVLFFKLGYNWMELAWVLFDGLLEESEVVRIIKDIQLRHPFSLNEQVNDLMRRWWQKKGNEATIQELQKALDLLQMFYIQEEIVDRNGQKHHNTEDDLDVGEVVADDPDVSRICQEYNTRSLNSSFVSHSAKSARVAEELRSEQVMRQLQTAKTVPTGLNEVLARVSRPSSRADVVSVERLPSAFKEGSVDAADQSTEFDSKSEVADSVILPGRKKKKQCKRETNL